MTKATCRLGELDAARAVMELALQRDRDLGLVYDQARALHALGDLHAAERKLGEAVRCLTESVGLWRLVGIPRRLAWTLDRLGSVSDEAVGRLDRRAEGESGEPPPRQPGSGAHAAVSAGRASL